MRRRAHERVPRASSPALGVHSDRGDPRLIEPPANLSGAVGLARLRRDQGRHAEARDLLAPVYGWFTEGFNTPI
jgi:hypothetical protein